MSENHTAFVAPSLRDSFLVWLKIGLLSFGGPAAQIALMHRMLVDEKRWLSEQQFLNAISFCMLLPGPEAMQIATYAGWRLQGMAGGLLAGLLFVLPGAAVILVLAGIYGALGNVPLVETLFVGVKACVLMIVVQALIRIGSKALRGWLAWSLALLSFCGLFFFAVPYPLIVVIAAALGFLFLAGPSDQSVEAISVSPWRTLSTILVWLVIWWAPLVVLLALLGPDHILSEIGLFFSKLAVVTFGGAYAVLTYMAQDVVEHFGWISAGQMLDGLGLAETTPGPLILVTEFVGFLAAFSDGGGSWVLGVCGALVALWVTFVPCFLWIFAGAPYIDWISSQPRLKGALTGITAAVVGVILNLSLWFSLHVIFSEVEAKTIGPLHIWMPAWNSLGPFVVALSLLCAVGLFLLRWSIPMVLMVSALVSLVASLLVS